MRASIIGLSGLILAATAVPAFAQTASPVTTPGDAPETENPISVSANVSLTSDYRFRGVGFSDGDIAVQGGIDVAHESGFYVGTWASSIEDSETFGHTELDLYGGWSGELTDGISVDVGLLYYVYPNGKGSATNDAGTPLDLSDDFLVSAPSDFFEPYASISGTLGPAEVTVGAAYAWGGQSALGDNDNIYVYTDLSVGIPNTPVTINGHVGYNHGSLSVTSGLTDEDYMDFSIGADYAITSNLSANLSYVTTETDLPSGPNQGFIDDAVVFTVTASF